MTSALEARMLARLTKLAGAAGPRGRTVASWADVARSLGVGPALRQARRRAPTVLPDGVRNALYGEIWAQAADAAGAHLADLGSGFLEITRGAVTTRVSAACRRSV